MCGIGGAIERELAYPSNYEPLLSLILKHQQPRGPDHAARVEISREKLSISLTHNRLAILDLTDDSNQPLIDPETGSCIVFNGEIYNFIELRQELQALGVRFFTQGDTEVLLKVYLQWGKAGLNKLNGMFAFAIWDPRHQKLILARDRFGVKPCYYLNNPVRFAFASTTTALAKFFEADHSMAYLARGVTYNLYEADSDSSPFANIHSLAPGHILEVSLDSVRAEPFYSLESEVQQEREKLAGMSDLQLIARLEDLLHSAVHLRLRSDVPVTISLSGGLDSALLASFMIQESNRPDIAFTLGKPGDRGGEADLALRSAKHLGLGLRFVEIDADKICDLFERTLTAQGAPFAHPSVMSQNRVFEEMSTHGFRVSIGGQGADEVFLGYRKFQFFHLRELLLRQEFLRLPGAGLGLARMLFSEMGSPRKLWHYQKRYSRSGHPPSPFREVPSTPLNLGFSGYPSLRDRQIADVTFASLATLLRYEDRNSMGHSVESRMPFLDYRLVRFGVALDNELKLRNGYGKWILRQIGARRLPACVVHNRAKFAFALDTESWLNMGLGNHLQARVKPAIHRLSDVFSEGAINILNERQSYYNPANFPLLVTARFLAERF